MDKTLCAEALYAGADGRAVFGGRPLRKNSALAVYGDIVMKERLCRRWLRRDLPLGFVPPARWRQQARGQ